MREILYRGKQICNGEWAYGVPLEYSAGQIGIVKCTSKTRILPYDEDDFTFHAVEELFSPKVDPSTVGQYTGLKDKNGVKIFEGDVIKFSPYMYILANADKLTGIVKFGEMSVPDGDPHEEAISLGFYAYIGKYKDKWSGDILDNQEQLVSAMQDEIEIVGNIYDNPELLQEDFNG